MYTKKTLADCLQSLADRHDQGTLPNSSSTLSLWTRILNRGVNYCTDRLRLSKPDTITVSSGTGNLADDFILINGVWDSGNNELTEVGSDDKDMQSGLTFWITGNHFDGFVLNVPTDGTYTIEYAFRPAEMVNNTDVCEIPDIEAPVAYAYGMIRKGESDPFNDADNALGECNQRLREIQSSYGINTDSIGLTYEG